MTPLRRPDMPARRARLSGRWPTERIDVSVASATLPAMDLGVYESLLTEHLHAQLAHRTDLRPDFAAVDDAEQALAITRYLAPFIERSLRAARTVEDRAALARRVLEVLPETFTDGAALHTKDPGKITRLDEVRQTGGLGSHRVTRPATPFSDAALMTNGRGEPTLAAELRGELASADRVDLLCAFVKWQGLRLLENQLTELRERGVPLRVITTTYLGATDARALDALVNEFGAEVRVNYETNQTRLHAKAWLLRRNTGFDTAYVGSSNLSHAALVDGLEWNVRLSAIATPHLLDKFRATFDSYWESREFEPYKPADDGDRLREALQTASGTRARDPLAVTLSGLEVRAKPFQAEMLEQLDAERTLHDRHRNLIVAATGTGKTVMAALDYRRLAREIHARDLKMLFVAHRKEILAQAQRMYREVLTDATFGELLVDGQQPTRWRYVFASIQSLTAGRLADIAPERFNDAGIPARAVSAETSADERRAALAALRNRDVNVLFAVDLFNEGLDIPEVDTVLFLRPTESATVFLQQLGRGLRLTHGKTVLTALDFVGHQRREFRFDQRFRALTGSGGKALQRQVEEGFPFLPSGSQIVLDRVAQNLVLDNIKAQVAPRWTALVSEVRAHPGYRLAEYLDAYGRELPDILKNKRSWTTLCREAGKLAVDAGPFEDDLVKRVRTVAHVDDRHRRATYRAILDGTGDPSRPAERRLAAMLFYSLFPGGGGFADVATGLAALAGEPVLDELRQVIDIAFDTARRSTYDLGPELAGVPLQVHATYSREEILAALDFASQQRTPSTMREGVAWCKDLNTDAFLITLKKSETDYSPTTMYRDFAISDRLFHWESQSTTSSASPTGQRYIHHRENGSHILLFVRAAKTNALGAAPYVFLGPAEYVSHEGDKPMAITWRLHRPMPAEVFQASSVAVA